MLDFHTHAARCRDMSYDSGSVPFAFFMWQNENLYGDPLKAHKCSSTQQTLEKDYLEMEGIKVLPYFKQFSESLHHFSIARYLSN